MATTVVFSQQLNLRGLPSERSDRLGTQYRQRDTYSWDGNGNLTADNDLIGDSSQYRNASRWLQYDGLDRLTVADSAAQPPLQRSSPWSFSWSEGRFGYDALDNLRTFQMGYLDYRYQYIGHRLSTIQQGTDPTPLFGYGHNSRGQVTSRQFEGDSYTLSWDSAHRLTRSQNAAATKVEQYRYDNHGHRARTQRGSETVWQVYSRSGDLMFERSSGGSTLKYARLGGRLIGEIRAGGRLAIHTDVIGSVRQKTNAMGTVVDEDVRAPYGSVLVNGYYRNGPAFTGHMEDGGTGLTYMKARYYDPVSTRFLSPDPVYVDLGSGANFNRYLYANNNPYTYTDPDGRKIVFAQGASGSFKEKMNDQLDSVRKTDTGRSLISKLEDSEKTFVLSERKGSSRAIPEDLDNAKTKGVGTGGEIQHDPDNYPDAKTTLGNMPTPPEVVLGHELKHAVDFNDGTLASTREQAEDDAVRTENAIRLEKMLPRRTEY
jgi:RHS repeat-associated protein